MGAPSFNSARNVERHVVLCADRRYAQHVAALWQSILAHRLPSEHYRFWVLTSEDSVADLSKLGAALDPAHASASVVTVDDRRLPTPPAESHFSKAALYRLLAPEMVAPEVRRLLYLDVDMIVRRNLGELFDTELPEGDVIAAVRNVGEDGARRLGLPPAAGYFNSGLMLIDVPRWKAMHASQLLVDLIMQPGRVTRFYDQDVLNIIFATKCYMLDPHWNQQNEHFLTGRTSLMDAKTLNSVKQDPYVVHYAGALKPWHFGCDHPFRGDYYAALDQTAARGWRPRARGITDWVRLVRNRVLPFHLRCFLLRATRSVRGRLTKVFSRKS